MRGKKNFRFRPQVEILEKRELLTTYLVGPGGSDSNNGVSAPWLTLQHAANSVKPGDTVEVETGTYKGFDVQTGGTASAPITFEAAPGATPTITSAEAKRGKDGINIEDIANGSAVNYVTIQGFVINNPTNGTITEAGIRAVWNESVNSTGIVLNGNTCNNCGEWGIITGHEDHLLIEYNTCSNSQQQHGIYVGNAAFYPVIKGNILFGNAGCGLHMNGDASQDPAVEPDGTSDGNNGNIVGALVEDNIIYDNGAASGGSAINGDGVQNSIIENNLLYDNHASGISLFQQDAALPSTNNVVANNTIIEASDGRWCINIQNGSTGNSVFNNILLNNNTGHGSIAISTDSLTGFASNDNIVTTSNNAFDQVDADDNDTFMSLATWRGSSFPGTGQDLNSISATASQLFVNAAVNNYLLVAGSPAIDAGVATFQSHAAPTTDLAGNARPSGNGYDIGAYEFQSASSAPAAPTNLAATAGNVQVALTWSASSGATSYDVYRGTAKGGENATPIATNVSGTTFTDTGLTNGTTYYYEVSAVNISGQSGKSNEAVATPQVPAPAAPTNLTATGGNAQVVLTWTASSIAKTYDVYRGTATGGENVTPIATGITSTGFTDIGLTNGTTYYYEVTAVNAGGQSGLSTEASAAPASTSTSINLSPATLPAGSVGGPYSQVISATGGTGFTFRVSSGSLPPGLALNSSTGALSGMPYSPTGSPFAFTVTATDHLGNSGSQTYHLTVASPLGTSLNAIYVENVYGLLLHRTADAGGLGWVSALNQGLAPASLVADFENSTEYFSDVVVGLYQHYLNRAADPGGLHGWVNALLNGTTIEQVIAGLVGSPEFFQNEGHGTNAGFITALYQDILNRAPDPSGYASWLQALNHGTSRTAMATSFLGSLEYKQDLVSSYYQEFLRRAADPSGLASWAHTLQAGLADQTVLAAFLGSAEGFAKWS